MHMEPDCSSAMSLVSSLGNLITSVLANSIDLCELLFYACKWATCPSNLPEILHSLQYNCADLVPGPVHYPIDSWLSTFPICQVLGLAYGCFSGAWPWKQLMFPETSNRCFPTVRKLWSTWSRWRLNSEHKERTSFMTVDRSFNAAVEMSLIAPVVDLDWNEPLELTL